MISNPISLMNSPKFLERKLVSSHRNPTRRTDASNLLKMLVSRPRTVSCSRWGPQGSLVC